MPHKIQLRGGVKHKTLIKPVENGRKWALLGHPRAPKLISRGGGPLEACAGGPPSPGLYIYEKTRLAMAGNQKNPFGA